MDRALTHQLSTLMSALIVIGAVAYSVGRTVVTFIFWAALTVVRAFVAGDADPVESGVVIAPLDVWVIAGALGLALVIFCLPRLHSARRTG